MKSGHALDNLLWTEVIGLPSIKQTSFRDNIEETSETICGAHAGTPERMASISLPVPSPASHDLLLAFRPFII